MTKAKAEATADRAGAACQHVEDAPTLVAVAKLVSAKILAAGEEAGAKYDMNSQVGMMGHNSNVYDMKVMDCVPGRAEEKASG